MSEENGLINVVAGEVDLPPERVSHVLDTLFCELHHRMYVYEGFNGDYVCERLLSELPDLAWFHLFQFLVLYKIKYCSDCDEDVILESGIQLGYLGGTDRWQTYIDDTTQWRTSRHVKDQLGESAH